MTSRWKEARFWFALATLGILLMAASGIGSQTGLLVVGLTVYTVGCGFCMKFIKRSG